MRSSGRVVTLAWLATLVLSYVGCGRYLGFVV